MEDYPKFRVTEIKEGDEVALLGSITATKHGRETWIGDHWLGYLLRNQEVISGRWRAEEKQWAFVLTNRQALELIRGVAQWDVLDGYWGERAEIVFDTSRDWRKMHFQSSDAVEFQYGKARLWTRADSPQSAGGNLIERGWDHEHCAIYWETIGMGGQHEGYFSDPNTWVCEECFNKFVLPRSLSFIPPVDTNEST